MRKTIFKRVFAFVSALVIGGIALVGSPVNATAATLTEEQIAQNEIYRDAIEILETEQNMTVLSFEFSDFCGFDVMVLRITAPSMPCVSTQLIASDGSPLGFAGEMEYSEEGGYIRMTRDEGEKIRYDFAPANQVTAVGPKYFYNTSTKEYTDYKGDVLTQEDVDAINEEFVPNPVALGDDYVFTEANLNKYLPVSDAQVMFPEGTYTLNTVTLQEGEVFALSNTNIDKLISSEVVALNDGLQKLYFGDNVTIDSEYVSKTLFYEFYDAATLTKVIHKGYWTAEESNAFFETGVNNTWTYNGVEVIPVEEGEGVAYYNIRADKAGTTTVTISDYQIGDSTIKLIIPFKITAAPVETPEGTVITSTSDSKVTVTDASNVLPAGTTMNTEKVESGAAFDAVVEVVAEKVENTEKVAVYEINLEAAGVELHELSGVVKVTVDAPFEVAEGKTIKVYRVEGTELIPCNTTVVDGKVIFETNHFSTYVFVEETAATSAPTAAEWTAYMNAVNAMLGGKTVASPKTGDTNVALMVAMLAVATAGVVVLRRKAAR